MARTEITKWKFHVQKGYYPFMRQGAVLAALESLGEGIAARAGEGVSVESSAASGGRGTPRVGVYTESTEAKQDEAKNRTLTRALDG